MDSVFFFRALILAGGLWIAAGCTSPPDTLGGLDLKQWRADRRGCNDVRKHLDVKTDSLSAALLGKSSNTVGEYMGKPDIQQLGGRNQKVYIYFLESGPQCKDITAVSSAEKLVFRFNAVGLLKEINRQRIMPE